MDEKLWNITLQRPFLSVRVCKSVFWWAGRWFTSFKHQFTGTWTNWRRVVTWILSPRQLMSSAYWSTRRDCQRLFGEFSNSNNGRSQGHSQVAACVHYTRRPSMQRNSSLFIRLAFLEQGRSIASSLQTLVAGIWSSHGIYRLVDQQIQSTVGPIDSFLYVNGNPRLIKRNKIRQEINSNAAASVINKPSST